MTAPIPPPADALRTAVERARAVREAATTERDRLADERAKAEQGQAGRG